LLLIAQRQIQPPKPQLVPPPVAQAAPASASVWAYLVVVVFFLVAIALGSALLFRFLF
jgi:hypothetical protein